MGGRCIIELLKAMAKLSDRDETGLLKRGGEWLFLENDAGHHWRLDVEEDRARPLVGLRVRVRGRGGRGTIKVKSIARA